MFRDPTPVEPSRRTLDTSHVELLDEAANVVDHGPVLHLLVSGGSKETNLADVLVHGHHLEALHACLSDAEDPPATVHAVALEAPAEVAVPSRSSGGKGTVPAAETNPPTPLRNAYLGAFGGVRI